MPLSLSIDHAQTVVHEHFPAQGSATVKAVSAVYRGALTSTYRVDMSNELSFVVKIALPSRSRRGLSPNDVALPLARERQVLEILSAKAPGTPLFPLGGFDYSCGTVPFPYIVYECPGGARSLSELRKTLSPQRAAALDLRTGALLKGIHAIDNDFFGPLVCSPGEEMYRWEEAFTLHLETLLQDARDLGLGGDAIPYERVRLYLSRAISRFLFDDVEVPSLVWWDSADDAVWVSAADSPSEAVDGSGVAVGSGDNGDIVAFTSFSKAMWGDPLMERVFSDPDARPQASDKALLEGYGGALETMPRHRTKRLWYTLFVSLDRIVEGSALEDQGMVEKGCALLGGTLGLLETAPYY